jgi:hypothetical protein
VAGHIHCFAHELDLFDLLGPAEAASSRLSRLLISIQRTSGNLRLVAQSTNKARSAAASRPITSITD